MKFQELPYERIDYDKTAIQLNNLLDKLEKEKNADRFIEIYQEISKINIHIQTMATIASVRHCINTKDEFYDKENEFWDETSPLLQAFDKRTSDLLLAFEDRESLYKVVPNTVFKLAECAVKVFDEKIIPLLQQENKLSTEYGALKAGAQIVVDDVTYNLAGISKLADNPDRNIRKKAMDAKWKFYQDNQTKFDEIYDNLVKVRTEMAHQLGFKNYTEMGYLRMYRIDYNQEMVEKYRQQILDDIVPFDIELYTLQQERLHLDALHYYDETFEFESGNPTPKGSSNDLVNEAVKMYHEMSKETHEFIDVMNDNDLWDLISRDGKELGGFTTSLEEYKVPFIFANFNGTSGDVDVLTHEAGHAFQYYMSRNIDCVDAKWPTMESCEIHSMSMEFFAYPWIKNFFKEDTEKYFYTHFTSTFKFLPYGVLIDHFQHEIYNHPEMSIAERKTCYRKLEKMYLPYKNYEGIDILEEGCWWYQQGHVFQSPFYYIDYTLAQVCALQFWDRQYQKDPTAFKDYLHLCSLGGTKSFTELVKEAKLISPFEEGCVKSVVKDAKEYLKTIDQTKL